MSSVVPSLLDDDALLAAMVEIEDASRALHHRRLALLSEAAQRGVRTGDKSLTQWYCHATLTDTGQVRR